MQRLETKFDIKTDVEILEESLSKYKDKNGKKALNLKFKIECAKAFQCLCEDQEFCIYNQYKQTKIF